MKTYIYVKIDDLVDHYKGMIVATSHQDPLADMESISEIEGDLRGLSVKGNIIFDMLACIGDNSERYLTINFNGENFDLKSCKFIQYKKHSKMRKISMNILKEMNDNLNDTILTSSQINLLRHGVAI